MRLLPMKMIQGLILALAEKLAIDALGQAMRQKILNSDGVSIQLPLKAVDDTGNEYVQILLDYDTDTLEISANKLKVKNHSPATSGTVSNPVFNLSAGTVTYGTRSMGWKRQNGYTDVLFSILGTAGGSGATIVGLSSFPTNPSGYNSLPAEIGRFKFEDENSVLVKGFIDANSSSTINFDQAIVIAAGLDFQIVGQFRYQSAAA